MKPGNKNSYKALKSININGKEYKYYSINEAEKKKTMQVDSKQLNTISRELLIEPSSIELEKSYLKDGEPAYEEDFVRNEIMKSKQRQDIESFVKFFKKFGFLKGKE